MVQLHRIHKILQYCRRREGSTKPAPYWRPHKYWALPLEFNRRSTWCPGFVHPWYALSIQILADLRNKLHTGMFDASRILHKLEFVVHVVHYIGYVYSSESSWNTNPNTLEPDRQQHTQPAACVIVQQCSSAIFVSERFYFRKGKFGMRFKMLLFLNLFLNCVNLTLHYLAQGTSARVCTDTAVYWVLI